MGQEERRGLLLVMVLVLLLSLLSLLVVGLVLAGDSGAARRIWAESQRGEWRGVGVGVGPV